MKFLIVIPTHNEEENILRCLDSLRKQSFQDFSCIVVNDGSTDNTRALVEDFIENIKLSGVESSRFTLRNLPKSEHQPGAKVVRTFNKGLEGISLDNYDIVCKFDADIIFPDNYLEHVQQAFQDNSKYGLVGGLLYIERDGEWVYEGNSNKNHVRGPMKAYRKECFLETGGLRETLGWDNIDSVLLESLGWKEVVLSELHVKLLKVKGKDYSVKQSDYYGRYFYFLGLKRVLAYIAASKEAMKNKSVSFFFQIIKSYEDCRHKKYELKISKAEQEIINAQRWKAFKKKWFKI